MGAKRHIIRWRVISTVLNVKYVSTPDAFSKPEQIQLDIFKLKKEELLNDLEFIKYKNGQNINTPNDIKKDKQIFESLNNGIKNASDLLKNVSKINIKNVQKNSITNWINIGKK